MVQTRNYSLEEIAKAVHADSAAILLPNLEKRYLYVHESYNQPDAWVKLTNAFYENRAGGNVQVYKTGKPAITNSLSTTFHGYHFESIMIVPIIQGKKVLGTVELMHVRDEKTFSDKDEQTATELASKIEIN